MRSTPLSYSPSRHRFCGHRSKRLRNFLNNSRHTLAVVTENYRNVFADDEPLRHLFVELGELIIHRL